MYLVVHVLEAYALAPLLHWRIVRLPPALTIFSQTFLFVLLGLPGAFLATPIVAALRVLVLHLYVEDVLEGRRAAPASTARPPERRSA